MAKAPANYLCNTELKPADGCNYHRDNDKKVHATNDGIKATYRESVKLQWFSVPGYIIHRLIHQAKTRSSVQ